MQLRNGRLTPSMSPLLGLFSEGVGRRLHGLELSYGGGSLFEARNAL